MCSTKSIILSGAVVLLLAWLFRVYPWMFYLRYWSDVPPVSYDGRIIFNLHNLTTPKTEDEIKKIVVDANDSGGKIRVVGAGHSWSEIAQTEDIMISLAEYTGLVHVNEETKEATFKAGTSLGDMIDMLLPYNLTMSNLGSVTAQSIAGAISTATHGTSLTVGNIATTVTRLRFVSGTGQIYNISKDDHENADIFKAAQVSIGMLGVLTEVTIQAVDLFNLVENRTYHSLSSYCLENLDDLVLNSEYTYVKMWVDFHNDFCVLFNTNRTNEQPTPVSPLQPLIDFFTYYSFAVLTRIMYLIPSSTPTLMKIVDYVGFSRDVYRVARSDLIFTTSFVLPIHAEAEIFVSYNHSRELIETISQVIIDNQYPVNYLIEIRWVEGDDIWLSPEYDWEPGSCTITLTIYSNRHTVNDFFMACFEATKHLNPRFHWGKHFYFANHTRIQQMYPMFSKFDAIRENLDPNGVFVNNIIRETFLEN